MTFLNILLAFAAGALIGDSILHIIPHAYIEVFEEVEAEAVAAGGHGHRFL